MATAADVYYISSDMTEKITGLSAGGSYLNTATITYALKNAIGDTLVGGTGSYTYTAASNGNYTAPIESTVTTLMSEGATYYLHVTIVSGNYNAFFRLERWANYAGPTTG